MIQHPSVPLWRRRAGIRKRRKRKRKRNTIPDQPGRFASENCTFIHSFHNNIAVAYVESNAAPLSSSLNFAARSLLDGVTRSGAPAKDACPVHVQQEIVGPVSGGRNTADDIPLKICDRNTSRGKGGAETEADQQQQQIHGRNKAAVDRRVLFQARWVAQTRHLIRTPKKGRRKQRATKVEWTFER